VVGSPPRLTLAFEHLCQVDDGFQH